MNPDFPTDPGKELEARLSALILGQLPEEQAAELRQQLDKDPELLELYTRLERTAALIREAVATEDPAKYRGSVPRLSHHRREQLLASFKTISPGVRARSGWSFKSWAIPAAAAAMIIILGAGLLPSLTKAKSRAQRLTTLAGRSVAETELPGAAAGTYSPEDSVAASFSGTVPPLLSTLSVGESRREALQIAEPSAEVASRVNSAGRSFGGFGGGNPAQVAEKVEASPPQIAFAERVDANGPLPNASLNVPAQEFAAKEYLAGAKSQSSLGRIEPEVKLRKKMDNALGAEIAQVERQNETEGLQVATNVNVGNANVFGHVSNRGLYLDDGAITPDSRKLAEAPAISPGSGIALNFDSDKAQGKELDEYFAKDVPRDAKQASVESLKRFALPGDSAGRLNKTPATAEKLSEELPVQALAGGLAAAISDTAAVPAQAEAEVSRGAAYFARKSGNDSAAIQAGKPTQLAQITEEKSKGRRSVEELDRAALLSDLPAAHPTPGAPVPQPESLTRENRFSTFSMNVSDVSFKLAAAALEKGVMPEAGTIRSEEFINAFNYHDPEAAAGAPLAFAWETARSPFAHNRDLIRFSVKTAAQGRQPGRPLNIVVLLDNSGSMERADRARIIQNAFRVLATQLQAQDRLSIVLFARTAQLWVDGATGDQAANLVEGIKSLVPQGGTNLEDAMNLAYQTAVRHFAATGVNRVVLLTDGAANLGDVEPTALKEKVESFRKQGIALDCFGIGWEGYNDELMETLSRNGDGRYGFLNTPEEAESDFVAQLAGALRVAASDVKVQVEFNPERVNLYRQIGYAKHQLTKEQFRDNTVDAAEIGAAESGNALYSIEVNPSGMGPIATLRVRFKIPGTTEYKELEWLVPYKGNSPALEQASPAMRLVTTASAFSEWLASNPYAAEVTTAGLLKVCEGVPQAFASDARPRQLEWMIRQAQSLSGK